MSLLLQALQKASKNREDGPENDPDSQSSELSLEPVGDEPQSGFVRAEAAGAPAGSPAYAATVMQAAETPRYTVFDWMQEHYMLTFVGASILFAIGYGTYVYIQVSNPGLLRPPAQIVTAPPPPAQSSAQGAPAEPRTPAKVLGMPAELNAPAAAGAPAPEAPATRPAVQTGTTTTNAGSTQNTPSPKPRTAQSRAAPAAAAAPSVATPAADDARVEDGVEVVEIPASPRIATPEAPRTPRDEISVRRQPAAATPVNPQLQAAYDALQQGDYAASRTLYLQVLSAEPRNIDALLGVAAIAWKQGRNDEASRHFTRVLELDPRNTHAQAGLIGLLGAADPLAAESQLRQLIGRDPSAFLYFTLGNLLAEQNQWASAQQAYFQAFQLQPDNPDYAFNLAVGLEHLGQAGLALNYYRRALDMSFRKGRANFDQGLAIERVGRLSARVE